MRTILIFAITTAALFTSAQSPEKGAFFYSEVWVIRYHPGAAEELIARIYSTPIPIVFSGTADTVFYEFEDGDSIRAYFKVGNDQIPYTNFDHSWPLHQELIYGDPIFSSVQIGQIGLGGYGYDAIWSFTDSALFSFKLNMLGNPSHFVKLQKAASPVEESADLPIILFPNPASDVLNIQLPAGSAAALSLLDVSGREVKTWKCEGSQPLDVSGLDSGNYLLRIIMNGEVKTFHVQKVE